MSEPVPAIPDVARRITLRSKVGRVATAAVLLALAVSAVCRGRGGGAGRAGE